MSDICKHIELAESIADDEEQSKDFAGFDLAGAEFARKPSEMRSVFMPMMERCIPITIHAGEDEPVKNIWEAVYHLNADRIGHGLTLEDDPALLKKFRDRKIAIELCPSSNYQIVGFKDYQIPGCRSERIYPLKEYIKQGLKVTINTDDPGISKTDLTQEYYKAACMTKGGLSKWEILKLIKNGFQSSFLPLDQKKKLILEVENKIIQLLNRDSC
jgi:adenosine deaminase